jgi:hypothetical protein
MCAVPQTRRGGRQGRAPTTELSAASRASTTEKGEHQSVQDSHVCVAWPVGTGPP